MRFRPWLGDSLSFLYDSIMKRSVFPKKFAADQQKHDLILKEELSGFRKMKVLELVREPAARHLFSVATTSIPGRISALVY
ncbi:MAG TPA: hypothetical protein PLF98_02515 [Thermotogota bacterium]|nr:hypothetical protein [Thermotogota bacterium]